MYLKRILPNPVSSVVFRTVLLINLCWSLAVFGDAKSECDALTGGIHTRVVWREGGDAIKGGGNALKGFDSKTGEITTIFTGPCIKSVICYGGHKVVYSAGNYSVWVVDYDGSNNKQLTNQGCVTDGWRDPEKGTEWCVYRGSGVGQGGGIHRINIDDPSQKVKIYGGAEGHKVYGWFQMSADGTMCGGFFPYDKAGVLDIATGKVTYVSGGCWASTASDNSYNWFHLKGGHKGLVTFNKTKKIANVNTMVPGVKSSQIYCPRIAEGTKETSQYFVECTGYGGSYTANTVEIYMGKFDKGLTKVEKFARITNNNVPDAHPSVWIGVESKDTAAPADTAATSLGSTKQTPMNQLSVRMVGSKTFELILRQKAFFEIEIVNLTGSVIERSSIAGRSQFRWSGQTAGVYLIRLTGQNGVTEKKITLW